MKNILLVSSIILSLITSVTYAETVYCPAYARVKSDVFHLDLYTSAMGEYNNQKTAWVAGYGSLRAGEMYVLIGATDREYTYSNETRGEPGCIYQLQGGSKEMDTMTRANLLANLNSSAWQLISDREYEKRYSCDSPSPSACSFYWG